MFDKTFMITLAILTAISALAWLEKEMPRIAGAIFEVILLVLFALAIRHWILPIFTSQ